MYRIFEKGKHFESEDLSRWRNNKDSYDLWIDLDERTAWEKEKGAVEIFSKRILGKMLVFLLVNAGKTYTPKELYELVWGLEALDVSEEISVRTGVSRLRSLIEPVPSEWKYIKKTDVDFLGFKGAYYFNPTANYCMIAKVELIMFLM